MFFPGRLWRDTQGNPIHAHGGGILHHRGMYYWFGEHKDGVTVAGWMEAQGVACYASPNLVDWTYKGIVLPANHDDPTHDLHVSRVMERPKVVYNALTQQFVMWLHVDDATYSVARAGVAISSSPTGPYHYLGSIRPCEADSRDLTVFADDDGAAYLAFSSEYHRNITIALLDPTYQQPTDAFIKTLSFPRHPEGREAPALFKRQGRYYLITSGCTGWEPNAAACATATHPLGTWTDQGNPCVGDDSALTFHAQSTFVLPVVGREDAYIFMADRWNSQDLRDSRYVWLPCTFSSEGQVSIPWRSTWDLTAFDVQET